MKKKVNRFNQLANSQEEVLQSNWADSYADLMSLLVCFLTVLLSASIVSAQKFEKVSQVFRGKGNIKSSIKSLEKDLKETLKKEKIEENVDLVPSEDGLDVVVRDTFLFPSGTANLTKLAQKKFKEILFSLRKMPDYYRFSIEGHTDDRKVSSDLYPSNWHLSTARAIAVLELFLQEKFSESRLSVQGFADQVPLVPNRDFKKRPIYNNMSKNRRVVIKIR